LSGQREVAAADKNNKRLLGISRSRFVMRFSLSQAMLQGKPKIAWGGSSQHPRGL